MSIRYALYENAVRAGGGYAAAVKISSSQDLDGVVRRMLERGSTISRADILAVLEDAIAASESMLLEGQRVNFGGLVQLYPRLRGNFTGPRDGYDPARHRLDVGASPGARVRNTVRAEASAEKVEPTKPAPSLVELLDVETGGVAGGLTVGGIGQLTGQRLRFDAAAADEGLFFVAADGSGEVKAQVFQKNKPGELVFVIPPLPGEAYRAEVRSRPGGVRELRRGGLALDIRAV